MQDKKKKILFLGLIDELGKVAIELQSNYKIDYFKLPSKVRQSHSECYLAIVNIGPDNYLNKSKAELVRLFNTEIGIPTIVYTNKETPYLEDKLNLKQGDYSAIVNKKEAKKDPNLLINKIDEILKQ